MNLTPLKIFVSLGISILTLVGCDSLDNKEENINNDDFFKAIDKMLGVNYKDFINLEGDWKFSIGDDMNWASVDFDDSDWEEIHVPSSWEEQGFQGYNGYAWYRKSFEIPKELQDRNFILNAGFIDDIDQTFVNGKLVGLSGGSPPQFVTAYNAHREYYVSKEILKAGTNIIAVRVYDAMLEGGITRGYVGFSPAKSDVLMISNIELDINLSGSWKFKTGDNLNWINSKYDDSEWREIFVPAFWEIQGYRNYNGFAWYKKSFTLPEKFANSKMVLLLGKIDDIDQAYINGTIVGSIGDWNFDVVPSNFNQNSEWETLRGYYIPVYVLKPGAVNTISVRVYDGYLDGGIYQGPVGLITQEKYVEFWNYKKQN
jgi:sialate O-acetylesterase